MPASVTATRPAMATGVRLTDRLIVPNEARPNAQVRIVRWKTLAREVKNLPRFVKWYCGVNRVSWNDVLILSPRRQIGYMVRDNLRKLGMEALSFFHEEALDSAPARERFTLLTLLANLDDRVALRCWLGIPTQRPKAYREVWERCNHSNQSLRGLMDAAVAGRVTLSTNADELVSRFKALTGQLSELEGRVGAELVAAWLGDPAADDTGQLADLREMAETVCSDDPGISPVGLRERLLDVITQPELPTETDCIRVMSLHKSKGLTAKLVIIAGFAQGLIPFVPNGLTPDEYHKRMQEQRRLFFVSLTRVTECLVLSSAKLFQRVEARDMSLDFQSYSQHWVQSVPSPFAAQLGPSAPAEAIDGDEWLDSLGVDD